jgi:ketosteroid isomerase-like protein
MTNARGRITSALAAASMIVGIIAFGSTVGWAQQTASNDDGAKAASKAFYAALSGTDVGAMKSLWAHTPNVVYVGPSSKSIARGWSAVESAWDATFGNSSRTVTLTESYIQTDGKLAWEVGNEIGTAKGKDGIERKIDVIVTNVYEKQQGGRWLMVSHHAQPKPQ